MEYWSYACPGAPGVISRRSRNPPHTSTRRFWRRECSARAPPYVMSRSEQSTGPGLTRAAFSREYAANGNITLCWQLTPSLRCHQTVANRADFCRPRPRARSCLLSADRLRLEPLRIGPARPCLRAGAIELIVRNPREQLQFQPMAWPFSSARQGGLGRVLHV